MTTPVGNVLVTSTIVESTFSKLAFPPYNVVLVEQGPFSAKTLLSFLEGEETIALLCGADEVSDKVLRAGKANGLRFVVKCGVSLDNIDVEEATKLGIGVAVCPPIHAPAVAELSLAFMFALLRHVLLHDHLARSKDAASYLWTEGELLGGRTVLVVGFGQVGRAVALRLLGLGSRVMIYQPRWNDAKEADYLALQQVAESLSRINYGNGSWTPHIERVDSLDRALPQADLITLHASPTVANKHMIDEAFLSKCKRGFMLINTAWGLLIDESALDNASRTGTLGGFGCDVFSSISQEVPELAFSDSTPMEGIVDLCIHQTFGGVVALAEWMVQETLRNVSTAMNMPGLNFAIPQQVRREMHKVARKVQRSLDPEPVSAQHNVIYTRRVGYRAGGVPRELARHAMRSLQLALKGDINSVQWVVPPRLTDGS